MLLNFCRFLVEDPNTGYLVVVPSNSPENAPRWIKKKGNLFAGITMDNQLVFDLFSNTCEAAKVLGEDDRFCDTLKSMRGQLPPMQVGQYGQLQEWFEDWDHPQDHHRHISHLWGLYPGYQISPYRSPVLLKRHVTRLYNVETPLRVVYGVESLFLGAYA